MSHVFQLSDEQYTKLAAYAAQHKQTPEMLFQKWVSEMIYQVEALPSSNHIDQAIQELLEGYEEEPLDHPLFKIAGMFAIGEPGWADKHDEYLAATYLDNHADEE